MFKKRIIAAISAAALAVTVIAGSACAADSAQFGDESSITLTRTLSNPNADQNAVNTYNYICDTFGKNILTCQQESTWMDGGNADYEMEYIEETTGKLPAMRGLDFMNNDFDGVVERAKEWSEKGGIVTICWHTGVESSGYNESLSDDPDFDKLLTEGTDEYNTLIESWDKAAEALAELRDAGVTVLWRPFHEFDGQWFWWGKGGADNFVKLWQMQYEYFTEEKNLTNLIWVLGYADDVKDGWYPGDEYCDIVASDTYKSETNSKGWKRLVAMDTGKPIAYHECGDLASIEDFENDGTLWSYFMVWHTSFITDNDKDNLKAVYNSDEAITLDELPDVKNYTGEEEQTKIAFIGDSICYMGNWAELFDNENIDNYGVGGNTTSDVLARFDSVYGDYDKIFIICGVNDWSVDGWNDGSYSGSMENYKQMFELAAENVPGAEVYVTGILPTCGEYTSYIDYNQSENYNAKLKALTEEYDYVTYIDGLWDALIDEETGYGNEALYLDDGLHPNSDGYEVIKTVLEPYVGKAASTDSETDSSSAESSSQDSSLSQEDSSLPEDSSSEGVSTEASSQSEQSDSVTDSAASATDSTASSSSLSAASSSATSASASNAASSAAGSTASTDSNPTTGAAASAAAAVVIFGAAMLTIKKKSR